MVVRGWESTVAGTKSTAIVGVLVAVSMISKNMIKTFLFQNCLSLTQSTSPLSSFQLGSPEQDTVNRHALQQAMRPLQHSTLRYFQQQQQQQQQSLQATLSSLLQYPLQPSTSTLGLEKPWIFPTSSPNQDKPWLPLSPTGGLPSPIPNTNSLERAAQFHRNAACKSYFILFCYRRTTAQVTRSRHSESSNSVISVSGWHKLKVHNEECGDEVWIHRTENDGSKFP